MRVLTLFATVVSVLAHALPAFAQTVTETEPNDTPETADTAVIGGKASGDVGCAICGHDPFDYWVILVQAGDTIRVDVDSCPLCVDAHTGISLMAADGNTVLVHGTPYDGSDEFLSYVATVSGRYFIRVGGSHYGSPPYTLNFTPAPSCPADSGEPNDATSSARALTLTDDLSAIWCPAGDRDVYRANVTAGTVLEFWVTDSPAQMYIEPRLRLLDAEGQLIGDEVFYAGSYPNRHLLYQAPSDGPLYLEPRSGRGSLTDTYKFHVRAHLAPPPGLTLQRAGRELMRPGVVLTDQERSYLDAIGNKNGAFDIGDFRAFVQLNRGVAEWW